MPMTGRVTFLVPGAAARLDTEPGGASNVARDTGDGDVADELPTLSTRPFTMRFRFSNHQPTNSVFSIVVLISWVGPSEWPVRIWSAPFEIVVVQIPFFIQCTHLTDSEIATCTEFRGQFLRRGRIRCLKFSRQFKTAEFAALFMSCLFDRLLEQFLEVTKTGFLISQIEKREQVGKSFFKRVALCRLPEGVWILWALVHCLLFCPVFPPVEDRRPQIAVETAQMSPVITQPSIDTVPYPRFHRPLVARVAGFGLTCNHFTLRLGQERTRSISHTRKSVSPELIYLWGDMAVHMATAEERGITTIQVERSLHARLKELKPYNSMTFNEFIEEMADEYADNN